MVYIRRDPCRRVVSNISNDYFAKSDGGICLVSDDRDEYGAEKKIWFA